MALIEVLADKEATDPLFLAEFDFLPRVGEHLARHADGYFQYYNIIEVWHRQLDTDGAFRACALVALDD